MSTQDDYLLKNKFINTFSLFSYRNRDYAEASFHTVLGQLLVNQRILKGGNMLDPRVSTFALWGPSGGKSAALDFTMEVCKRTGLRFTTVDSMTDAALIGTVEEIQGEDGPEHIVVQGFLNSCDIMHIDEADVLFRVSTHGQNIKSFLQKALNPIESDTSLIRKKMAHGDWIETKPTCSLYLTSYLPSSFEEAVLGTGFFQRLAVVPKQLSIRDRQENSHQDIELLGQERPTAAVDQIIKELNQVKEAYKEPMEWQWTDVKPLLRNHVDKYYEFVESVNTMSRDVVLGFIPRYQNMLYQLSLHNCALRYKTKVTKEDVKEAHTFVFDILKRIVTLLELKTDQGKEGTRNDARMERMLITAMAKVADEDGWASHNKLIKWMQETYRVSPNTAETLLFTHQEKMLQPREVNGTKHYRLNKEYM